MWWLNVARGCILLIGHILLLHCPLAPRLFLFLLIFVVMTLLERTPRPKVALFEACGTVTSGEGQEVNPNVALLLHSRLYSYFILRYEVNVLGLKSVLLKSEYEGKIKCA